MSLKNFTIITSGGCNAKCSFCTDPMNYPRDKNYLNILSDVLTKLPEGFNQVSISGGEPTISPDIQALLAMLSVSKMSGAINKVVLTTNGTKLLDIVHLVGNVVDHVNVSRHGIGYNENVKVFGNKTIISDEDLLECSEILGEYGVDINLNYVYTKDSNLDKEFVFDYVKYAKSVGATKITFRYDQEENTLEPTYLEKLFSVYKKVEEGGCPVCRSYTILVKGMYVTFKASYAEPHKSGNYKSSDPYELIYHPSAKLTTDWAGNNLFDYRYEYKKKSFRSQLGEASLYRSSYTPTYGAGGCGSGGCGR